MSCVSAQRKAEIRNEFKQGESDTGSPEVQVAILTDEIVTLTDHAKRHPKDKHSRVGLMAKVNKRRKLLTYLKRKSNERYLSLIERLGLRR